MSRAKTFFAALPMYDWPEVRHETDEEWHNLRMQLMRSGMPVAERLARKNSDIPPVPGGIRSADGELVAPDPAGLPADELDLNTMWRHPDLALAQTCWGPLELGLANHVRVIGQPDYSAFQGGQGIFYRSAILMRRKRGRSEIAVPDHAGPAFDPNLLKDRRFACNGTDSMSGLLALRRDLVEMGVLGSESEFNGFCSNVAISGSHRRSAIAVAEGRADMAAIDCRTLDLCRRFEPAMAELQIVGWTGQRKGLPYVTAQRSGYDISLSSSG